MNSLELPDPLSSVERNKMAIFMAALLRSTHL